MSGFEFVRDDAASRFTLSKAGDLLSVLDFRDDGHQVTMTRAFTVPTHRGHGYAGELVDRAVATLEKSDDRTVVPMCWYVAEWFDANPDRRGILAA